MRKRVLYISVMLICISIITGGTFAYFSADDVAHNVITTNQVDIKILDQKLEQGSLVDSEDDEIPIMPGITVSKVVSVKNYDAEAWIRMKYTVLIRDAEGAIMETTDEKWKDLIIIEPGKGWTEKNGWWYCNTSVKTGEKTTPLFETISFAGPEMGNEYQNCTIELDMDAQGVQKANNGSVVLDAAGWPEE